MATIDLSKTRAPALRSPDPAREVLNQPPPLQPVNLFEIDLALREALAREGGEWGEDRARETGATAGSVNALEHGKRAERNPPILRTHDRYGNRIDAVELDPSWHRLLRGAIEREIHGLPWREQRQGAHVVRAALFSLWSNANSGVMCPVSMTYAAVPALRDGAPELAAKWEPRLTATDYDDGALAGMAMTERQGGSDVRVNITRAEPVGDGLYELHGHKWFCSYPSCDVFLVLAQAPGGLSCLLVERGAGMEFQRLKDKLGTRSLPSSEVEFHGASGRLIGEEGRGVPAIVRMVNHTRLDCLLGASTSIRRGTLEAIHHARHRSAFGAPLVEQPAMRNVLARSGDRIRGGDGKRDARRARLRRALRRVVPALRHRGDEVLGLQARSGARGGGARVPGRKWLRRGLRDAAAISRRALELDLGGLGQRRRAGRDAGDGEGARRAARVHRRVRARGRGQRSTRRAHRTPAPGNQIGVQEPKSHSSTPAGSSRTWPWACRPRCSSAIHRRRSPTRSAPRRLGSDRGRVYGTLPPGVQATPIIDRAVPV